MSACGLPVAKLASRGTMRTLNISLLTRCSPPRPATLDMEQAAAVGTSCLTAWLCVTGAEVKPDETVLVIGSRGAVGSAASQIGALGLPRV